jgi:hypothetical protein
MADVTFRSDAVTVGTFAATITITEPAGASSVVTNGAGDVLVSVITVYDQNSGTFTPPATGPTWTLRKRTEVNQSGGTKRWSTAIYTAPRGSGAANYTWTIPVQYAEGYIACYQNVDVAAPWETSGGDSVNSGESTTATGLGVTATRNGSMLLWSSMGWATDVPIPAGFTDRETYDSVNHFAELAVGAGSTGNKTSTLGASDAWSVQMGILRPILSLPIISPMQRLLRGDYPHFRM